MIKNPADKKVVISASVPLWMRGKLEEGAKDAQMNFSQYLRVLLKFVLKDFETIKPEATAPAVIAGKTIERVDPDAPEYAWIKDAMKGGEE